MTFMERIHQPRWIIASAAVVLLVAVVLFVTKPWLAFIDVEVNDTIPGVAPQSTVTESGQSTDSAALDNRPQSRDVQQSSGAVGSSGEQEVQDTFTEPRIISQGSLISHEHETSGTVAIWEVEQGRYQLVLENLNTSNGPDVRVWLSKAPVVEGFDGWFLAASHDSYDLGPIKGNIGNQVYDIPMEVTIDDWTSMTLWCEDFSVSFGAAELKRQ